jgi:thiol-disulfide isomerase/thioredoxin
MRPIEDEQEKDKSIGSRRFVPNFFRRKSSSQPGTSEEESQIIQTVETLTAYKDEVVNQNDLVVVRFYAPWCKSCKASFPQFKQLISKYPQVKYVQVPLTKETAYIHEGLGVPSVPYAHIYHPTGGLVEEKKINKRVFGEFAETLDWYVRGECDLPVEEEIEVDEEGFQ